MRTAGEILAQFLINEGIFVDPPTPSWPLYVNFLPDDGIDEVGAIYDTLGVKDGRYMSGENVVHHGIQVQVRGRNFRNAAEQMDLVRLSLEGVRQFVITVDSVDYNLVNVSQVGTMNFLGLEKGSIRRNIYSMNFLATIDGSATPPVADGVCEMSVVAHAVDATLLAAVFVGHTHTNGGAGSLAIELTLAAAVKDMHAYFIQVDAANLTIRPSGSDHFLTSTGSMDDGEALVMSSPGSSFYLVCDESGRWMVMFMQGVVNEEVP